MLRATGALPADPRTIVRSIEYDGSVMVLLSDSMRRLVDRLGSGRVTTRTPDGARQDVVQPWLAVWDDTTLVFADVDSGPTVSNLVQSPPVEVAVAEPGGSGFRFAGRARVLLSGPTFDRARSFYAARGLHSEFEHIVFVDVADCTGIEVGGPESSEAAD